MTALLLTTVLFAFVLVLAALWYWLPDRLPFAASAPPWRLRAGRLPVVVAVSLLLLVGLLSATASARWPAAALLCGWLLGLSAAAWLRSPGVAMTAAAAPVPDPRVKREVLDAVPMALAEVDAERRVLRVNRALLELLQVSEQALPAGTPVARLVQLLVSHSDARLAAEVGDDLLEPLLHQGQVDNDGFVRIPAQQGRWLGLRLQVLPGGGWLVVLADLTDRQRMEQSLREMDGATRREVERRTRELRAARQEAEQANVSRTRFLTAASHDLLQPMNAARLLAGSLADQVQADPETRSTALRIEAAIVSAESILEALLEAGRLDAHSVKPRLAVVTLARLFEALGVQFAPVAARRKLRLRLRHTRLQVHSDPLLLQRLLSNLLSNALRYTSRGGVLVGARQRGDSVLIQVFDTGIGIDPMQQQVIFNEFRTGRHESPWGERGLGLGLALCSRTALLLKHPFGVVSTAGRGSCFHLTVPMAGSAGVAGGGLPDVPAAAPLKQLSVLCIDDNRDSLAALSDLLKRWGATVRVASDYRHARELVGEAVPDVLLVDYLLGAELDGFDVIAELRRLSRPDLPAAVVSATRSDFLRDQAETQHCELFLKPVKPALLKAWLSMLPALHEPT